jgi:hypothetical protein
MTTSKDREGDFGELEQSLQLSLPQDLRDLYCGAFPANVSDLVYRPAGDPAKPPHVLWALDAMRHGAQAPDADLVPVMPVDDASFACLVCAREDGGGPADLGTVVRWHLGAVPARAQRQILDVGLAQYVATAAADLRARGPGLEAMKRIAAAFSVHDDDGTRAKLYEVRPIRLAVQNVVIGLAAVRQESTYDALAADAWQTCEAPHVNAHEGARGLLALTLTEAFRAGGTMEIRFDRHPERRVPAMIQQFARVQRVDLAMSDPVSIAPAEARQLFFAVTRVPDVLRSRIDIATRAQAITPERACFLILAKIWSPIEMDMILGLSERAPSILKGGADPLERLAAQAEGDVCRAARMIGMLWARLSNAETETDSATRFMEDARVLVDWVIDEEEGAIVFTSSRPCSVPWVVCGPPVVVPAGVPLVVVPRAFANEQSAAVAERVAKRIAGPSGALAPVAATLQPRDQTSTAARDGSSPVLELVCPDNLAELDREVEAKLQKCRVGRA